MAVAAAAGVGVGVGARAGVRLFRNLLYQSKGRELTGLHRELDALTGAHRLNGFYRTVFNVSDLKSGLCTVTVQVLEVYNRERGALIRASGITPVDAYRLVGLDPGIAVVGVHQIQILDLIDSGICTKLCLDSIFKGVGTCSRIRILDNAVEQQRGGAFRHRYTGLADGVGGASGGYGRCLSSNRGFCWRSSRNIAGGVGFCHGPDGEFSSLRSNVVVRLARRRGNNIIFIGENGNLVLIENFICCRNGITFDHFAIFTDKLDAD